MILSFWKCKDRHVEENAKERHTLFFASYWKTSCFTNSYGTESNAHFFLSGFSDCASKDKTDNVAEKTSCFC